MAIQNFDFLTKEQLEIISEDFAKRCIIDHYITNLMPMCSFGVFGGVKIEPNFGIPASFPPEKQEWLKRAWEDACIKTPDELIAHLKFEGVIKENQ